jgi:hypothetical protein
VVLGIIFSIYVWLIVASGKTICGAAKLEFLDIDES